MKRILLIIAILATTLASAQVTKTDTLRVTAIQGYNKGLPSVRNYVVPLDSITALQAKISNSASIGTGTINSSAILTLGGTTKGFLTVRLTKAQREAISNPEIGLEVYDTDRTLGAQTYIFTGTNYFGQ
jgi:hypothetical protein